MLVRHSISILGLLLLFLTNNQAQAACTIGNAVVTATSLNLRDLPQTGAVLGKARYGQGFEVFECRGDWARVGDDRSVWAHSDYLSTNVPIGETLFATPEKLCRSLAAEGLRADDWHKSKAFPGEYLCMTTLVPFGPAGPSGLASNIAFYVYGSSREAADEIRVKININERTTRVEAFKRVESASTILHETFGLVVPPQLRTALADAQPTELPTAYGSAALIYESGNIDSFIVVLKSSASIAAKQEKIGLARSDYERCRQAASNATGHTAQNLIGDGDPVEESGYISFFLKGPNRDQLFCEVHANARYKIKAALGGKYPFRYIDEGTLPK